MREARRKAGRIAAVGAAVAVLGSVTGAAHAGPADGREASLRERAVQSCPQGYVCFWAEPGFRGVMRVYKNPRFHVCGWVPQHYARSVVNQDNQTWSFYGDVNCTAHVVTLDPGQAAANVVIRTWK
ncbi:peptidase inhibitor family I36 protein [Streptomyces zingiberis]|uniref:Peptidase inhibitor family I36 protein n=1 Tax=Streptomyces zingiberis TaxID=2053010 RepID=A0ABX1C3V4_9ACTN|nr:peptidase inhibitor family I36 protein [Streptomyces zingiberis]NJQ03476.1 peptidase inhibitor family I36 protein [Streptomyces zingiberis]